MSAKSYETGCRRISKAEARWLYADIARAQEDEH